MQRYCNVLAFPLMLIIFPFNYSMAQNANSNKAWEKLGSSQEPRSVKVINGIELQINGVRCQLFGIRLPKNTELANKAKRFLEFHMKTYNGYFFIYNQDFPIAKDGVPLVWINGNDCYGWLQEPLLQAGLVEVDFSGFENYSFKLPGKDGMYVFNWKKCLLDSVTWHKLGKKPKMQFQ